MASFNIYASGANRTSRPWIYSSGANRQVKQAYVYSGGVNRLVYSATFIFTVNAGSSGTVIGYHASPSLGSLAPTNVLPGGQTITTLQSTSTNSTLIISGFSADPGSAFFTTLVSNSHTLTSASASYSYGSGVASWTWASTLTYVSGGVYPSTINF
jgi:hypothetical protein